MRISLLPFLIVFVACTILFYRMAAWRRTVVHATGNIASEVKASHQETIEKLAGLERHLEAIDHCICMAADFQANSTRRYQRLHRRLARIERRQEEVA